MNLKPKERSVLIGSLLIVVALAGQAGSFGSAGTLAYRPWHHRPWSFGVISDT